MEYTLMDPNINVEEHYSQQITPYTTKEISTIESTKRDSLVNEHDLTQYGVSLEELYTMARNFVKEKEGKAINFSYDDRNKLFALAKQIHYGKYRTEADNHVGMFDLIGKDRLQLWKSFGEMTKDEAMKQYVNLLIKICPYFKTNMEAHKRYLDEEIRKKREKHRDESLENKEESNNMINQRERVFSNEEFQIQEENKRRREEMHKKQIQEALNQQTYPHFKAYAEQQHPNNLTLQNELIRQLQDEHYEQYMNQVYQQQLYHQQQQAEQLKAIKKAQKKSQSQMEHNENITNENLNDLSIQATADDLQNLTLNTSNEKSTSNQSTNDACFEQNDAGVEENDDFDEQTPEMPPISAATLLTRKDINEFKQMVRKENDAIIKVGSGETVTVRVPTHDDGRLIFWEFATDHFDLAFGLYFEWTIAPTKNVTVHVSDSSEDEEENVEGDEDKIKVDAEKGGKISNKPPCDEIIPIFRRDCHQEVYAGSHLYPGRGVYLLKFDNSYSLWRSKTLYYRVYYSK